MIWETSTSASSPATTVNPFTISANLPSLSLKSLRKLVVEADSGRNDLQVGERKISGNAQLRQGEDVQPRHAVFDSEVDRSSRLNVNPAKFSRKRRSPFEAALRILVSFFKER